VGSASRLLLNALDFWLGAWTVRDRLTGERAGENVVDRVLDGYAILEHWRSAGGIDGKSLFFWDRSVETWRQVWVSRGDVKEKSLVDAAPGRARFEGVAHVDGRTIPDRTTLTALDDGSVAQLIEHSLDRGGTWTPSFDAIYVR